MGRQALTGVYFSCSTDVLTIFDPVIDRIVSLVSQQVRRVRKKGDQVKVRASAGLVILSVS